MSIIEWIVTSCILLALISAIRLALKKKLPAKVRYGMWLIVLVGLLLPVDNAADVTRKKESQENNENQDNGNQSGESDNGAGQDRTVKSWEIRRGFLGEAPTGMEDLEERLEGILQELTTDTAQQPTDAISAQGLYTFAVQVSGERKLTVALNMSQLPETYDASRSWEDHFAVDRILVYEGEELLQTIEPASVPPVEDYLWEGLFVVRRGRIGEPDIRDLNFDGSQDFGLLTSATFPRNVPYSYFLWNDAEGRFDYGFTLFSDLEADAEKRQLIEKTHETTGEYTTVYSYTEDGVLRRQ